MLNEVEPRLSHQQEKNITKRHYRSSGKASAAQKARRHHFKLAVTYARAGLANPVLRDRYHEMAQQEGKLPRGAAISDYLKGNDLLARNSG